MREKTVSDASVLIDPVRPTSACELVVEQLRRAIHLGRFLAGDKLPPERELAKQLGVSRTTVREAVPPGGHAAGGRGRERPAGRPRGPSGC